MKKKIEHPKVFISYAWGTKEHDDKVIFFATELKNDGVEVVFDKWQLIEGADTYAFMEKSAIDKSITNVLILLDPLYAKKADQRSGGVGAETQIISPEVYSKVEQKKFIPVVFERNEDGEICKPQYLKGLLHFDMTQDEKYDAEYQRLVRRLYGIDTIKEPELGNPPAWLDEIPQVSYRSRVSSEYYKGNSSETLKKKKFNENLLELVRQIDAYSYKEADDYIKQYLELKSYRDEVLLLLKSSDYIENGYKMMISALEEIAIKLKVNYSSDSLKKTLIHELFIYIIAYYFKQKDKEAIRYILNKTYFVGDSNFNEHDDSFNSFYDHNQELDEAVCKRDEKKYYCGTTKLWMEQINVEVCSKSEFIFGDLFCYNSSYLIENYRSGWAWFPLTYVYNSEDRQGTVRNYALKLKSSEHLEEAAFIMGYSSKKEFIKKYTEIEEKYKKGEMKEYRYSSCFENAPCFWDSISHSDLGIRN
ncbi:MAG: TIR domain-containing protein [Lachnospiraceae bacterium]